MADWDVVANDPVQGDPWAVTAHEPHNPGTPKDYDPAPANGIAPEGFHTVTGDDGKKTLRHDFGTADVIRALSDLPGVGAAERIGQGVTRLAGKAASGIAGLFGGPEAVQGVQDTVNQATELPPSNDPVVQAQNALGHAANAVAAPVDHAVGNLPPGARTAVEGVEEAIPDIAAVLGNPAGAGLAQRAGRNLQRAGNRLGLTGTLPPPETPAASQIARSPAEVGEAAGYTGLSTKADLSSPGNQAITDTLISRDAGIVPGHRPSVASLENARKVGPGRVYAETEASLPEKLTQDDALKANLSNLPNQVSQLPRSPDVDALQETMLAKQNFTRDELFANIREARERAKAHWKSDDPDKDALGDAYHSLANAYEDFAGRQPGVDLPKWQAARVQMAKNYQAQAALRGPQGSEHFNPHVYARLMERDPHLLTGDAAVVGTVAGALPTELPRGVVPGIAEGAEKTLGYVPIAGPLLRAKLEQLRLRGNPAAAAGAATDPALSYFFNQGKLPPGWNRAPSSPIPQFGGYLPSPAMVNAGGGASTQSALEALGLTPDVQAAGGQHPAAARLQALRERLTAPPERPAEPLDFQGPQKWGDFSLAPPNPPAVSPEGIPFENVLEQGGTQGKPVAGIQRGYRPAPRSPKGPNMRTPPGAPELTTAVPQGPSPAQVAFRNQQAAARLRKIAGDLRLEGPGGATGTPSERLRAALERQQRGYADGGEVRNSSSPGSPGFSGAVKDALAALRDYYIDRPRREIQAAREHNENQVIDDTVEHPAVTSPSHDDYALGGTVIGYAKGGSVRRVRPIQEFPRDERGLFIEPDVLTKEIVVQIEHNRQRAANKAYYADKHCGLQKGYDPKGKNPCGECNQADGEQCLLVEDDLLPKLKNGRFPPLVIDRKKGSCGPWEVIDPNDPEQRGNRIPASIAGYGIRKGGGPDDAFGCHVCWKRKKSKHPVLLDRTDWCGEWGTTVEPNACCIVNGADTVDRKKH